MFEDDECCGNCKFWTTDWQDDPRSDVGQCTRFPPTVILQSVNDLTPHQIARATKFPVISYVHCCGEWKQGETE